MPCLRFSIFLCSVVLFSSVSPFQNDNSKTKCAVNEQNRSYLWTVKHPSVNGTVHIFGDKSQLPGYMHSISSTEHFIILPITSLIINPCKFKEPPRTEGADPYIQQGDFYDMVPMRFLVFDKRTNSWLTQKPLVVFVSHQLNAFEDLEGIGRAFVPISVPFGFHNRFFSSQQLEKSELSKTFGCWIVVAVITLCAFGQQRTIGPSSPYMVLVFSVVMFCSCGCQQNATKDEKRLRMKVMVMNKDIGCGNGTSSTSSSEDSSKCAKKRLSSKKAT